MKSDREIVGVVEIHPFVDEGQPLPRRYAYRMSDGSIAGFLRAEDVLASGYRLPLGEHEARITKLENEQ